MKKKEEIPLRLGVGIVLLNDNNEVFVGKRIDNPEDFWQMPQGGVDKNENFLPKKVIKLMANLYWF